MRHQIALFAVGAAVGQRRIAHLDAIVALLVDDVGDDADRRRPWMLWRVERASRTLLLLPMQGSCVCLPPGVRNITPLYWLSADGPIKLLPCRAWPSLPCRTRTSCSRCPTRRTKRHPLIITNQRIVQRNPAGAVELPTKEVHFVGRQVVRPRLPPGIMLLALALPLLVLRRLRAVHGLGHDRGVAAVAGRGARRRAGRGDAGRDRAGARRRGSDRLAAHGAVDAHRRASRSWRRRSAARSGRAG